MQLFKERLKESLKCIILSLVICGVVMVLTLINPVIPAIIILLAISVYMLALLYKFVYWLFIEPFRK